MLSGPLLLYAFQLPFVSSCPTIPWRLPPFISQIVCSFWGCTSPLLPISFPYPSRSLILPCNSVGLLSFSFRRDLTRSPLPFPLSIGTPADILPGSAMGVEILSSSRSRFSRDLGSHFPSLCVQGERSSDLLFLPSAAS